jgi:hypothetical protein
MQARFTRRTLLRRALGTLAASPISLAVVELASRRPAFGETRSGTRVVEWVGELSSPESAVHLELRTPVHGIGVIWSSAPWPIELRTRGLAGWSAWVRVEPDGHGLTADGRPASALRLVPPTDQIQVKPSTPDKSPSIRLVGIDAADGPLAGELVLAAQATSPTLVRRSDWGADPSILTWRPELVPARKFAIHHTVTSDGGTDPAVAIRAIYFYHAVTLGWGDIGYNFIVDRAGRIYEGRAGGLNVVGAHSGLHSAGSDGIALLGTFEDQRPPDAMLGALAKLIAWRCASQGVSPTASAWLIDRVLPNVYGHKDVMVTECPGDAAYSLLPQVRQQAAALLGGQVPRPAMVVAGVRISPTSVSLGDPVRVDVTVRSNGNDLLPTQGPPPQTVYRQDETYTSLGFPEQRGATRIGLEVEGGSSDHPYRWGLGGGLAPGDTRTVSGLVRFERAGRYALWAGVTQEGQGWLHDNLGRTTVNVYQPGASSYAAPSTIEREQFFPLVMRGNNGWNTTIAISNPGNREARGQVVLHAPNGDVAATAPVQLPARGSMSVRLDAFDSVPSGFVGAAFLRSDEPVAAAGWHDRSGSDRMSSEAVTSGARRLYAPLVAKRYRELNTGIQILNLGRSTTRVSLTYITETGASWGDEVMVPPMGTSTRYTPSLPDLPDGFVGTAILDSLDGEPIAAVVNEVRGREMSMAYLAASQASDDLVAPLLFRNRNGWASGLQVMNVGGTAAEVIVTIRQTNGSGGPWEHRMTLGHAIAGTVYLPALLELPDDLVASASVRSAGGQPLVVLANSVNSIKGTGTVTAGMAGGGESLHVPFVTNEVDGWRSGLQVLNRQPAASAVTLTFANPEGEVILRLEDVVPGDRAKSFYLPGLLGIPNGFGGSVTIQGRAGASLGGQVNDVR